MVVVTTAVVDVGAGGEKVVDVGIVAVVDVDEPEVVSDVASVHATTVTNNTTTRIINLRGACATHSPYL